MNSNILPRMSGILLHPTSLPSPYGIGDLGEEAYHFVDFLEASGQHLWQMLPLTHTGYGDSPYQSFSAFAGQPLLISPGHLLKLRLISQEDLADCPKTDPDHIDYGTIIPWKNRLLEKAYDSFLTRDFPELKERLSSFCQKNSYWLDDYGLFLACKKVNGGVSWLEWEDAYRIPTPAFKASLRQELSQDIGFYQFVQFLFFEEWQELKSYANEHGVHIIGDIPIFVSMDSADVWANRHLFQLDTKGFPLRVAGVPPDYFSETGQLWGNPLYQWEVHEKEGYAWWISRIKNQLEVLDILRIDHFRGFEAYWSVPYGEKTAVNGEWVKGPNKKLFAAIEAALGGNLPIIAEDLGVITPEVEDLRDTFHFPGMKVLQFAFESLDENGFLPHQFTTANCVCYTGTHDTDTTCGWYATLAPHCREKTAMYMNLREGDSIGMAFVRTALSSIAAYAIFPLQDVLGIGKEGRMNTPGVPAGNWGWRYTKDALTDSLAEDLRALTALYGRCTR